MYQTRELKTIKDAAISLEISEELVLKFIKLGIVKPIFDSSTVKLTGYNLRRLSQALKMYENSFTPEAILARLNN